MKRIIMYCVFAISIFILQACTLFDKDPVIELNEDFPYTLGVKATQPEWWQFIKAYDHEDGEISETQVSVDDSLVNLNEVGSYPLVLELKDSKGNVTKKEITIHVQDTEKPLISLMGDELVQILVGYPYVEPGVIVSDNFDTSLESEVEINLGGLDVNKIGTYTITYNVTDSSGNKADEVTRRVKVYDDLSFLIDDNLEKVVRDYLNITTGKITKSDIERVKRLTANQANLTTLKGLEYFTHLESFTAMNNEITDLTPLEKLENLKSLNLSNNQISDLTPLVHLKNLEELRLVGNQITTVDAIKDLKELKVLKLSNNRIESIDELHKLTKLMELWVDFNLIEDISVLRSLYESGAFRDKAMNVAIEGNPIDLDNESPSLNTIIFFMDHGLRLQYEDVIPTNGYRENSSDATQLPLNQPYAGYIGFSNDIDWYWFMIDGETEIEILYPKMSLYVLKLYKGSQLVPIPLGNPEPLQNYNRYTLKLEPGRYYIELSVSGHVTNGSYELTVGHRSTDQ